MIAECIVAVGVMFIPLAVVLLTTVDDFSRGIAIFLIILGVISLITGLIIAIRNEIRMTAREKRLDRRDNLRRRLDKANSITMLHIANKLGVDMKDIENMLKDKLSKNLEQELEDLENEL